MGAMVQMSARGIALHRLPVWPGIGSYRAGAAVARNASGVRGGSLSYRHAVKVWQRARETVAQNAGKLARGLPSRDLLGGICELEFVSVLAEHLGSCERCWTVGREKDTPAAWLTWAVGRRRGLEEIFRAVCMDTGVKRLRALPPGPGPGPVAALELSASASVAHSGREG